MWCTKSKYIDWQENVQSSIFILTNEWYNFSTINNSLWGLFLLLCSFDTLMEYQICLLFFLCAVISHCLPSGGSSQTSVLSTLYKTHFTSENSPWQGSSQGMVPTGWETEASLSAGAVGLTPLTDGHNSKISSGKFELIFFWISLYPLLKALLDAIYYNVSPSCAVRL